MNGGKEKSLFFVAEAHVPSGNLMDGEAEAEPGSQTAEPGGGVGGESVCYSNSDLRSCPTPIMVAYAN